MSSKLLIAGMDEVGRGTWAGPIVACAYVQMKEFGDIKLLDSKKMSVVQRELSYEVLVKSGEFGIGEVSAEEIDKFGLSRANALVFERAILNLKVKPDLVLIDGRESSFKKLNLGVPYQTIIKGDNKLKVISAASVIAKVFRDRLMTKYSIEFPNYDFENNKGYGTRKHINALNKFGVIGLHRKSFLPIKNLLKASKK